MAKISELREIVKYTPINEAILLEGYHGLGKSEFVSQLAKEDGAVIITIFLGQTSDAGDVIGLPTRIEVNENGQKYFITDFAQMAWWPRDPSKKYYILFDEINRAKPEMMNCIMDLILNRKMNGRELPPMTRIFAAMNPMEDGFYQVEDLDPALIDRFNVYQFRPTVDEWVDWAQKNDVHPAVVSFIVKYGEAHLDPQSSKDVKANMVQPSRRSWKRVSDILNQHGDELLQGDMHTLANIVFGIVGQGSTGAFVQHIKSAGIGLSAGMILTKMDEKIKDKLAKLKTQEQIQLADQVAYWLEEKNAECVSTQAYGEMVLGNLESFMKIIHAEAKAKFFHKMRVDHQEFKKKWPQFVAGGSPNLGKMFSDTMR